MWNISGETVARERFEPFRAVEVLDDYDGPRIFTLRDSDGELNLACWSDGDQGTSRYVVVPTTTKILDSLRTGEITVFDALNQPRCWACDILASGQIGQCWQVDFDSIPRDALPSAGTMLLPGLEPLLVAVEGRVRELDKDRLSFELREIHGPVQTQRFVFAEELLEDVFRAFQKDVRVRVAGRAFPVRNVAYALALSSGSGDTTDSIPTT
jgi:hypothetical protein